MKILVLAACLGVAASTDSSVLYASAPKDRGAYHTHDVLGKYHYGYNTGDGIAKIEVKRTDGAVIGSYRYYDPNGKQVIRSYIADNKGFRVLGNDLPIAHESVPAQVHDAPAFTAPVEGTSSFMQPTDYNTGGWARVPGTYEPSQKQKYTSPPWQQIKLSQPSAQYIQQPHHFQQPSQQLMQQQPSQQLMQQQPAPTYTQQPQHVAQQHQVLPQYMNPASQTYSSLFRTPNTLSHEMMPSPYLIYGRNLNYDFPAGFAYAGSGSAAGAPSQQPVHQPRLPQQQGPPYIIGRTK